MFNVICIIMMQQSVLPSLSELLQYLYDFLTYSYREQAVTIFYETISALSAFFDSLEIYLNFSGVQLIPFLALCAFMNASKHVRFNCDNIHDPPSPSCMYQCAKIGDCLGVYEDDEKHCMIIKKISNEGVGRTCWCNERGR